MQQQITHQSFESIVGETIDLQAGDLSFRAKVESVQLLENHADLQRQPFSVVLQAENAANHGQQLYQLSHPAIGEQSLFLVPIGPGEEGMCYEIVFN